MTNRSIRSALVLAVAMTPAIALAGPEWPEGGDAGAIPDKAQKPFGATALDKISGNLDGPLRSGDYQDVFLIRIDDFTTFSMSTEMGGSSDTTFNVQLFLFNASGLAQLANDDIGTANTDAALTNVATDGTGFSLTSNGYYFVAISGFNSDPLSTGGLLMFDQPITTEVSGPDGAGGSLPLTSWNSNGATGFYRVFLTGAEMICVGDTNGDDVVDGTDLAALLAAWGTDDYFSDFNEDDTVDGFDLAALLAAWGRCPI